MNLRRPVLGLLAAGLVLTAIALVRLAGFPRPPAAPPPEPLVLAISTSILGIPLWLAEREGFFAAEGLRVTLRPYAIGKLALEALLRGEADVATVAEPPVLLAALERRPLRVIANYASSGETSVVARADRGINAVRDLQGRRIGVTVGTTAHYFLHVLLSDEGLSAAAVTVVPLAAADQVTALTTGRVDAVSAFAPYSTQCRAALGAGGRTFAAGLRYTGYASLVTAPDFSRRRPAAALRLLRATDRAILWLRGHRREAIAFAAERLGTAEAVVAETWDRLQPNLSLDQGYVTLLQAQARWATAAGFAAGGELPEFHDLIDVSVLQRLHPESVTVIGTP